jgi:ribulose-phosphate 3-epimerase
MAHNLLISASILSADFSKLGQEIKKCEDAGVDYVHIDVMDGHFVPNISIGLVVVETVRRLTRLPLDVHLMIENPWTYIDAFADAGADIIAVHAECYGPRRAACAGYGQFPKEVDFINGDLLARDIGRIRQRGKKGFAVFNPGTPVCAGKILESLDGVLIMSVDPGFSGQKFNQVALDKIRALRAEFDGDIAVDGGINAETAPAAVEAGANILDTASYFFGAADPVTAAARLKSLSKQ